MTTPGLFSPLQLRDVTLRNRLVVSPMCQYSATDGHANDWHLVHLGRFALGGFGTVMVEATAVSPEGRITPGDVGLWDDTQIAPLARIAGFLRANGATPAIQLAHAGRKASSRRPWEGGDAIPATDPQGWETVAPSPVPFGPDWPTPRELTREDLAALREHWKRATVRALEAGFDIVEVHAAHGYLLHEFLSPITNKREDDYGGSLENRMRFPLEVIETVRAAWPQDRPLFVRISATDWQDDGWTVEDSVVFASRLKALGVDVVDCSSGGIQGASGSLNAYPGYQVPLATRVRTEAAIATMAVGLITEADMAERIVAEGQADLVAMAREALDNPQWPHHARRALTGDRQDFSHWPVQSGFWLRNRERARARAEARRLNAAE